MLEESFNKLGQCLVESKLVYIKNHYFHLITVGRYLAITYEESMTASNLNLNMWWIRTAKNNTTLELFPKAKIAVKKWGNVFP